MLGKPSTHYPQIMFLIVFFSLILIVSSFAQSPKDTTSMKYYDIEEQFRIEASFFGGSGSEEIEVGETTADDLVTISPGGGAGGKISAGYCLSSLFNINLEFGTQSSSLSEELKNAEGSFSRTFLLGTVRYKIPITSKSTINIGGGAGYYMGGKLDVDASEVEGGGHNIYEYENATGIHIFGEYEYFFPKFTFLDAKWSLGVGIRYYNINYNLDSFSSDGTSIPISQLPTEITDEFEEINGSGVDGIFSIIMHL